ncbi:hypothetical protein ACVIGB_000540 [Bradyrhizobium sp. USDA 4341]
MRWFKYEPFVPCRPDVYGEGIFVQHWQRLMREPIEHGDDEENERFASIVSPWEPISADAAAATSLISWLGTNCGRSFLDGATRRAKQHPELEKCDAYVLAWANENRRVPGWNHHRRTLDAILPADHINLRSVEIIEITVRWLGSSDGQRLILEAEAEIEETARQVSEQSAMKARAKVRASELVRRQAC